LIEDDEDAAARLLVEQVIAGQPGAVEAFIDRCGPVVLRVLRRFRMNRADHDDCWQNVFLKLFENDKSRLRAWRGINLSGYISTITNRVAVDLFRSGTFVSGGRTRRREVPLAPGFDVASDDNPDGDTRGRPSGEITYAAARMCLTPRQFEIYERYCRGEDAQETATALNITVGNVYVERSRMKRALRESLEQR
jgi:RNA polymerase sigma factor (sigma-70 family)